MKRSLSSSRIILLILILSLVSSSIMAQKTNLDTLIIEQLNLCKDKADALRNSGMILTLVGGTVFITGFILILDYVNNIVIWDWEDHKINTYGILVTVGGVSTIAGIPLWIIGGSRKTKTELTLQKFNIAPGNSMALGVGITVRF